MTLRPISQQERIGNKITVNMNIFRHFPSVIFVSAYRQSVIHNVDERFSLLKKINKFIANYISLQVAQCLSSNAKHRASHIKLH